MANLTNRQREVLDFIDQHLTQQGYPPSVREIGDALGLSSSSTVHSHLSALEEKGFLRRDPTKPRAIEVIYEAGSGAAIERRPARHVPLVGVVGAGTGILAAENIEESYPLPADLTSDGEIFMLKVSGDSMVDAGIFDGDFVVVRSQNSAENGEIVVAGIPGDEATVKFLILAKNKIILRPANSEMDDMEFSANEIEIYGKVVTVIRKL